MALECSRSGNGAHVWFFFEVAIPAVAARRLGSHILTETMDRRPRLGLGTYDRLFPNQDTLPRGGFGILIALPLQRAAREQGNSVFLDERLSPYSDQWEFLSSSKRISRARVEALAREAEARGRVVRVRMPQLDEEEEAPWTAPPSRRRKEPPIAEPVPTEIEIVLSDQLYVPKANLPPALMNRLVRLAAFQNPEFYRAQAMRLPTHDKPRVIHCAEDHAQHIGLPRGCLDDLRELLDTLKIGLVLRDERFAGLPLDVKFCGELRGDQQLAADALLRHETNVLSATTAFGKTVVASWLIACRGVDTFVLVHREQLLEQWVERLPAFLGWPANDIGRLRGGQRKLGGMLDVALLQSLVRKGEVSDCVANYGHLVVDECHHLSARSFELAARRAKARYVTGLSATVARKDGHHPIIFMQCGPVRHRVEARQQAAARPFTHSVLVRPTGFCDADGPEAQRDGVDPGEAANIRLEFQRLYEALWRDPKRNALICADVVASLGEQRSPLVLTERTEHLELLAEMLAAKGCRVIALRGGMGRRALKAALRQVARDDQATGSGRVLLATGRFIGEGFDDPRLDTLFLTLPVS